MFAIVLFDALLATVLNLARQVWRNCQKKSVRSQSDCFICSRFLFERLGPLKRYEDAK